MNRRPRSLLLLLLALLAAVSALAVPGVRADARAGAVPRSVCARYDHGVADGVCVRDARGGIYWLGTLRGYDGVEMYCIDYLFATDWGVAHRRVEVSGSLPTSVGGRVPASAVAALSYLVTRYPASQVGDTTAAAIGLVIREVMGDVRRDNAQTIPGGLTVGRDVRRVSFVGSGVEDRATALWREATAHRGPWHLGVTVDPGADHRVSPGERVVATVRGTNGAGKPQDMKVGLGYTGFTGPASVRLGQDGAGTVVLVAPPAPRSAAVSARVTDAPGIHPLVVLPSTWHPNPRPGHSSTTSQRGLIGRQDAVAATAKVVVEVHYGPAVVTRASQEQAAPGSLLTDEVTITGSDPSYAGPVTAVLHGPFPARPDAQSCATAPVAGTVTLPVHGDGTYTTPGIAVSAPGFYTWTESLPPTASQDALQTPCGVITETTVVSARPQVRTRTSATLVQVGGSIRDRVTVTGMRPGAPLVATALLYGPYPSLSAATCTGTPYASVRFPVARDGGYVSPAVRLRAAGIYTWVEQLPGDALSGPVTTPCGLVAETTLAHRTPPVPQHPSVPAGGASRGTGR